MSAEASTSKIHKLAKLTGWFYFLIILTSLLSLVLLGGKFTVMGDSETSVIKMVENSVYVRINVLYEVFMFSAVIVLSVLLFELTKYLNAVIARTAMLFRVVEAIMGYLGIVLALGILSTTSTENVDALPILLYDLKDLAYKILMVCISLGSILFFYLFLKGSYIPKILSIWGIVGFILMLIASLLQILNMEIGITVNGIAATLVIPFELVVGLWLMIKGVKTDN